MSRINAWLNLAYRFGMHVVFRMPSRPFGNDMEKFLGKVVPEGYVPLAPAERAVFPELMRCVHCGLCALACPAIEGSPASAWNEAWTFAGGLSRSIDHVNLIAADLTPCARCAECEAACPTGVPITQLATLVVRMAERGATLGSDPGALEAKSPS